MKKLMMLAAVVAAMGSEAKVTLGTPFADGMVLQRGRAVPVWGTADAGEKVAVSFAGQTRETTADAQGAWRVDLPEMDEGVNYLECEAEATARLELFANADLTGEVLAELNKGDRLHVYAFDRTTAYVEYNGVRGFVALRYLNKVD